MSRDIMRSIGMLVLVAVLAIIFTFGDQIVGAMNEMMTEQTGSMMDQLLR